MTAPKELQGVVTKVEPVEVPEFALLYRSSKGWIPFGLFDTEKLATLEIGDYEQADRFLVVRLVAQPEKREMSEALKFILQCATTSAEYDVWDRDYPKRIRDAVAAIRKEFA